MLVGGFVTKIVMKLTDKYEATPKSVQLEEAITIPFSLISLFALYGYIMKVAFFSAGFWKVYFALSVIHLAGSLFMPKQNWLRREMPQNKYVIFNIVGILISVPLFYILYMYGYVSFPQK